MASAFKKSLFLKIRDLFSQNPRIAFRTSPKCLAYIHHPSRRFGMNESKKQPHALFFIYF